jgi:hypothetical protein
MAAAAASEEEPERKKRLQLFGFAFVLSYRR